MMLFMVSMDNENNEMFIHSKIIMVIKRSINIQPKFNLQGEHV